MSDVLAKIDQALLGEGPIAIRKGVRRVLDEALADKPANFAQKILLRVEQETALDDIDARVNAIRKLFDDLESA